MEPCVLKTSTSFLYPVAYPPVNMEQMQADCKEKSEAIQCIKDQSKHRPLSPLIKRGLTTFAQARAKFVKKYCTNLSSSQTKKFVSDTKCIMEKKFKAFEKTDTEFSSDLLTIARAKGLGDMELKYFCCAFYKFTRSQVNNIQPECPDSKKTVEELYSFDINLLCEDEEKLADKCPKLAPIEKRHKFERKPGTGPEVMGLLIVATLGEERDV